MKTTISITALILALSFNSFAQSGFFGRKYTKGFFFEKRHALKHKRNNTETVSVTNTITKEVEAATTTPSVTLIDTSITTKQAITLTHTQNESEVPVDNCATEKQTYHRAKRMNTISVSANNAVSSVDTKLNPVNYHTISLKAPQLKELKHNIKTSTKKHSASFTLDFLKILLVVLLLLIAVGLIFILIAAAAFAASYGGSLTAFAILLPIIVSVLCILGVVRILRYF